MHSFVTIPDADRKSARSSLWIEALKLAREGAAVFPCGSDKRPLIATGFKAATADPDIVHGWWTAHPDALIGVPAGLKFVVVDADLQHENAQQWVEYNRHRTPLTRTHRTPKGGLHWLFAANDRIKCSTSRLGPHIDTRGDGGYIIWWPACGYGVLHEDVLAPVPEWMIEALAPKPIELRPQWSPPSSTPSSASLRGALRVLAEAKEGERNHALFWVSCRMGEAMRAGIITEAEATGLLVSVGRQVGLLDREILRTARSGFQEGLRT
jgi:Bifunctional DNA primase/polymerase, N-terminal